MKANKEWIKDIKISQELKDKIYYDEKNDLWVISWNAISQSLTELEELKKLQHIHIGIDCNNKDDTAIVIAQKRGDNVYVIYGKTRFTELSIDLDEVVKVAEEEMNMLKKGRDKDE